jgi:hypothetical protein
MIIHCSRSAGRSQQVRLLMTPLPLRRWAKTMMLCQSMTGVCIIAEFCASNKCRLPQHAQNAIHCTVQWVLLAAALGSQLDSRNEAECSNRCSVCRWPVSTGRCDVMFTVCWFAVSICAFRPAASCTSRASYTTSYTTAQKWWMAEPALKLGYENDVRP